eukprot:1326470-Amorphochlora_amoeboformis.AAC.1
MKTNNNPTRTRTLNVTLSEFQLLTVGIADPIPRIRETVILSLKPRFDVFLAQDTLSQSQPFAYIFKATMHAKNLHALFVALNDEKFSIRAAAMSVIGRLALRNPAHVMPSLRKTLIHLLTELQCGGMTIRSGVYFI